MKTNTAVVIGAVIAGTVGGIGADAVIDKVRTCDIRGMRVEPGGFREWKDEVTGKLVQAHCAAP